MAMRCPACQGETSVYDTRPLGRDTKIRRRRKCDRGHRFTTYEIVAEGMDVLSEDTAVDLDLGKAAVGGRSR